VQSLYRAIKEFDKFDNLLEAFGISATKIKVGSKSARLKTNEKLKVLQEIYTLVAGLDKSAELPEVSKNIDMTSDFTLSNSENKYANKSQIKFKSVYEDPKMDPLYKYQASPFKSPKNKIERKFDEFLTMIKDKDDQVGSKIRKSVILKPSFSKMISPKDFPNMFSEQFGM